MKVLILALSGIGDALMFTPALQKLKNDLPDAEVDALVMFGGVKELYENLPEVNKVHYINFLEDNPLKSFFKLLKLVFRYNVSFNVYPSNRKEYNIISFLVGAKKRFAVRYLKMDKKELGFLNNYRVSENVETHNVVTNILMVEKLTGNIAFKKPGLKFPINEDNLSEAEELLKVYNIHENDFVVGFHPGCNTLKNHINRRWPPEKFAELGKELIEEKGAKILIFGGPDEQQLKQKVTEEINSDNAFTVDTSSLMTSAAIMKRCNLFVTNDSGNMHIAASLNIPIVAVIGPTNTKFISPWKASHKIATLNLHCAPCFFYSPKPLECSRQLEPYKCVRDLNVELVKKNIEELFQGD